MRQKEVVSLFTPLRHKLEQFLIFVTKWLTIRFLALFIERLFIMEIIR